MSKIKNGSRLMAGLFAAVLLAGQIPFTYAYAEGKDETLSANTTAEIEAEAEESMETLSVSEVTKESQTDEAVLAAQALIDVLPTVEAVKAMDMDGQHTAYEQTQAAYDAYMALSETQRTLIVGVEKMDALFGYFNEQTAALATNDFTVTGGTEGTDYTYEDGVLTIKSGTPITIANANPAAPTSDRIEVATGVNANITLAGVNIDVSSQNSTAAFKIADDSTGNVTITLADGTSNILKSGYYCAGLQKNGGTSTGTLTIKGNTGTLTATGGYGGAGIGGGGVLMGSSSCNITISGGTVTAIGGYGGAGIGSAGSFSISSNITISGGNVMAIGGNYAAGIGGGGASADPGGSGSNITISGGNVTATGGKNGAGIGGGYSAGGTDITISGGCVAATGGEGAAGIGGGGGIKSGMVGVGRDIAISGGIVTVTGGEGAAGIGAGDMGSESDITIENSLVIDGKAKKGTVTGNVTLDQDFIIDSGMTLEIGEGSSLTVGENVTLTNNGTIDIDGDLINNGTIINNEKIIIHGRGINRGTITGNGSIEGEMITESATPSEGDTSASSNGGSSSSGAAFQATAPKTGDDSNIILWGMIFIFSGLGFCQTVALWRRREGIY